MSGVARAKLSFNVAYERLLICAAAKSRPQGYITANSSRRNRVILQTQNNYQRKPPDTHSLLRLFPAVDYPTRRLRLVSGKRPIIYPILAGITRDWNEAISRWAEQTVPRPIRVRPNVRPSVTLASPSDLHLGRPYVGRKMQPTTFQFRPGCQTDFLAGARPLLSRLQSERGRRTGPGPGIGNDETGMND
jgi:hypothetical protein